MEGYRPETYGDRIADVYDAMMADLPDPTDSVDRLAELAGPGPALELGIGTGRVALPLAARGVEVHGVDASEAMVGRLWAKPGGEAIPVTLGDFAGVPVEGDYRLVYVVFNTFFALLTQDDQVRCFAGVARRLAPGAPSCSRGSCPIWTCTPAARACAPPTWASTRSAWTWPATTRSPSGSTSSTWSWPRAASASTRGRSATPGRPSWT
jgi:SAM-dependent methyltransferase